MKTYYEMMDSFFKYFYTETAKVTENTQVKLLRSRYYLNLTYLDSMAKAYGEMGSISQFSLYAIASGLTTAGLMLFNPALLIIGGISLQFLFFIGSQYRAMEWRFSQMVYDLEESEKQLNAALKIQQDLAQEISLANENNQKLVNRLEQVGIEVEQIKERVTVKEQRVSMACDVIEKSAKQSQEIMERLLSSTLKVEEKERELIGALAQVCDVVKSSAEELDGIENSSWKEELDEKKAYRESVEAFLSENFVSILNAEDDEVQEAQSLHSFFSRRSFESVVGTTGKNSLPM